MTANLLSERGIRKKIVEKLQAQYEEAKRLLTSFIFRGSGGGVGLVYDSTLRWTVTRSYLSAYRFNTLACSLLTMISMHYSREYVYWHNTHIYGSRFLQYYNKAILEKVPEFPGTSRRRK